MTTPPSPAVLAAHARREAARLRFQSALDTIQHRLSPATLKQEAVTAARETAAATARTGAETIRNHPGKIAAGIGLVGVFLARKPIAKAIRGDATPNGAGEFDDFDDHDGAVPGARKGP